MSRFPGLARVFGTLNIDGGTVQRDVFVASFGDFVRGLKLGVFVPRTAEWGHLDISQTKVMGDFLRMPKGSQIDTKESFAGPIEITVVARMNSNDIRLGAFEGGWVIFNWADNPKQLRVERPDGDDKGQGCTLGTAPVKPLAPNTWYTLRWRINNQGMTIGVDDKVVYSEKGRKYNMFNRTVRLFASGTAVDVKLLEVKQLEQ